MARNELVIVSGDAQAGSETTNSLLLPIPPIRYLSESLSPPSDDNVISNRVSSNRYGVFELSRSPSPSSSVDMDEDSSEDPITIDSTPNTSPESRRHDTGNMEDLLDLSRCLPSLRNLGLLNNKNVAGTAEQSTSAFSSSFSPLTFGLSALPSGQQPSTSQWTLGSAQLLREDDAASRSSSPMHLSSHEGSPEPVVVGAWPGSPHTRVDSPRSPAAARSRSPSVVEVPSPSPIPDPRSPILRSTMIMEHSQVEDDDEVVEVPGPSLLVVEDSIDYNFSPQRYNPSPDLLVDEDNSPDRECELSPVLSWLEKLPEQSNTHNTEQERDGEIQKKLNDIQDGLRSFTKDVSYTELQFTTI